VLTYCYAWTPLVVVGSVALLALPWLGLIALLVIVAGLLTLLAGLLTAVVWLPFATGRVLYRRWQAGAGRGFRPEAPPPWTRPPRPSSGSVPAGVTAVVSNPRSRRRS
jgi:hypothetical protein